MLNGEDICKTKLGNWGYIRTVETDCSVGKPKWGFPKIRGTLLRVPIIRIIVFWGLYWGPLIFGKLPNVFQSYLNPRP